MREHHRADEEERVELVPLAINPLFDGVQLLGPPHLANPNPFALASVAESSDVAITAKISDYETRAADSETRVKAEFWTVRTSCSTTTRER